MTKPFLMLAIAGALCACGGPMSKETRADITQTMLAAQQPIGVCYGTALQANRRLRGKLAVHVVTTPGTGQFGMITIIHDELRNPNINDCVVAELSKLKLSKPSKKSLKFDFPLRF